MPNIAEEQDHPPGQRQPVNSSDQFVPVTPNDTVDLPFIATHYWIGTGGDLTVMNHEGKPVTFPALPGSQFFIGGRSKRVYAAGTTASGIVACR